MSDDIIGVNERPAFGRWFALSFQHVFAMFGATVLVPLLTGLSPSTALFSAGTGTLIYILCTGAKVPAFLGSSFAFIPALIGITQQYGLAYAMGGAFCAGVFYAIVAFIIKFTGKDWLDKALDKSTAKHKVVVTHHCPTLDERYTKYKESLLQTAFMADMEGFVQKHSDIEYWIFGHTHFNDIPKGDDARIGNTRILCNQMGYIEWDEMAGFRQDAIIHFNEEQ